jgi:putative transposase
MTQTPSISYKRHRFPPQIVAHAVWLYLRFGLSLREVEEMLLQRGIDVSYETISRWTAKFGPQIARSLRRRQTRPGDVWHLDEVVVKCAGKKFWLWRAVDQHGAVLEEILQKRRNKGAAGIVNLSALAEKEPRTPGQAAFNSHVMSSQMLRASERDCR